MYGGMGSMYGGMGGMGSMYGRRPWHFLALRCQRRCQKQESYVPSYGSKWGGRLLQVVHCQIALERYHPSASRPTGGRHCSPRATFTFYVRACRWRTSPPTCRSCKQLLLDPLSREALNVCFWCWLVCWSRDVPCTWYTHPFDSPNPVRGVEGWEECTASSRACDLAELAGFASLVHLAVGFSSFLIMAPRS